MKKLKFRPTESYVHWILYIVIQIVVFFTLLGVMI